MRTAALLRRTLITAALASACDKAGNAPPPMPPAEAYDAPSDFSGEWIGEVETSEGTLTITRLGTTRYRGIYWVEKSPLRYVLSLEQTVIDVNGVATPSNRAVFTWQDGRGGRGDGWLLINREQTALTGEFGEGAGHSGGTWTFIRVE